MSDCIRRFFSGLRPGCGFGTRRRFGVGSEHAHDVSQSFVYLASKHVGALKWKQEMICQPVQKQFSSFRLAGGGLLRDTCRLQTGGSVKKNSNAADSHSNVDSNKTSGGKTISSNAAGGKTLRSNKKKEKKEMRKDI